MIILAGIFSCLSGLTYGYDLTVVSVILQDISQELSIGEKWLTASMSFGILLSRMIGWKFSDIYGRIKSLILADIFIILGILCMCLFPSLIISARVILGIGVGLALLVGPAYLSEIAPPKQRGLLVSMHELAVCVGSLIGLSCGLLFPNWHWKFKVGISLIPSVFQLGMTFLLPESPKWLVYKNRMCQAEIAADKLGIEIDTLQHAHDTDTNILDLFRYFKRPLILAIIICTASSACGFYAVQSYYTLILKYTSPSISEITVKRLIAPIFGISKLFGVTICLLFIEKLGRRLLLALSIWICLLSHLGIMGSIYFNMEISTVISLGILIFGWSIGLATMMLLVANELLPTEYRSLGGSIALTMNSLIETTIQYCFKSWFLNISMYLPFSLFACYTLFALIIAIKFIPETKSQDIH
jgi:MFS family permease